MKDVFLRAAKTFVQAFVPVCLSNLALIDEGNFTSWKSIALSAVVAAAAAGFSALWNTIGKAESKLENNFGIAPERDTADDLNEVNNG